MKMTPFLKCAVLTATLLAATLFQVVAQQGGGGGRGGGAGGILTQEQRTKIRETIGEDLAPLMEKLAAAQKEVVKAATASNASEETVRPKVEAMNKIQTEITLLRLKGIKSIASTLTPEQKSQLESARDGGYMSLFGGFGGGRGGGGRRGGNN